MKTSGPSPLNCPFKASPSVLIRYFFVFNFLYSIVQKAILDWEFGASAWVLLKPRVETFTNFLEDIGFVPSDQSTNATGKKIPKKGMHSRSTLTRFDAKWMPKVSLTYFFLDISFGLTLLQPHLDIRQLMTHSFAPHFLEICIKAAFPRLHDQTEKPVKTTLTVTDLLQNRASLKKSAASLRSVIAQTLTSLTASLSLRDIGAAVFSSSSYSLRPQVFPPPLFISSSSLPLLFSSLFIHYSFLIIIVSPPPSPRVISFFFPLQPPVPLSNSLDVTHLSISLIFPS